jgi:hypothetical protein
MADLPESNEWTVGIYQLETSDPVLGGPEGIDNLQGKQLANRTTWLRDQLQQLGENKQASDATLTALSGLATEPNQMIYSTGPDAFAMTALSAFIRTLLDDADAATACATLGAATLVSPTFTGAPKAPTAPPGTNTTQLANTAFVQAAVAALVASSPAALDTLNELAAAIGSDPNFSTTMINLLGLKAPLASPPFTGDPKAPTPAQFDNDTSLATTEFVQRALGNKRFATSITASRAITPADFGGEFVISAAAPPTLTLPSTAAIASGASIRLLNLGTQPCVLARLGADAFIGAFNPSGAATSFSLLPNDDVTVTQYGGLWLVIGNGAALSSTNGANGFRYIGGGLIEQWGRVSGPANPANGRWDFDVLFPVAFPNACLSVVAGSGIDTGDLDASDGVGSTYRADKTNWQVGAPLANKFEAAVWYIDAASSARHFSWRAIGK